MSDDVLYRKVAQFTNDAFGGLDWARLAESATTKLGFGAMNLLSKKKNRGTAQLALFAPDWTLANLRILGKSLPGFKDMIPLLGKSEDAVSKFLLADTNLFAVITLSHIRVSMFLCRKLCVLVVGNENALPKNPDPSSFLSKISTNCLNLSELISSGLDTFRPPRIILSTKSPLCP